MDTFIGKAGKRLFAKHLEQYSPADPLYETYTNKKGQTKRRLRELPPGLSKRDARILKSVKRRAHHLDKGFHVGGFRFGYTFFVGLIPVAGDVTNLALNHQLIVRKAKQADIPGWLLNKMQVNNVVSTGVGFVPFVGDVFVATYKANSRNAALLEEFLRIRGEEFLKLHAEAVPPTAESSRRGGGRGWFRGKGPSPKDVEQVKPGAGMAPGEMRRVGTGVESDSLSSSSSRSERTTPATTWGTSSAMRKGKEGRSTRRRNKESSA